MSEIVEGLTDFDITRELGVDSIVLPLGISFFTFQVITYLVDVYRGEIPAEESPRIFAAYVALFPQLVAGPIVRFSEIREQFHRPFIAPEASRTGLLLFMIGFSKKVLIANNLGPTVDQIFGLESYGFVSAWVGALAYSFQLYFDFSGYSDMAIGLGLLIGFTFPMNFSSPYKATSITEFWRCWHMTLSRFLRDYLYVPLGGNRSGAVRTMLNLLTTMLLGGLWHGAAWNFVIWGGYHGLLLAFERFCGKKALYAKAPRPVTMGLTFLLVTLGWVMFRAPDLPQAMSMLGAMVGLSGDSTAADIHLISEFVWFFLGIAALIAFFGRRSHQIAENSHPVVLISVSGIFLLAVLELFSQEFNPFLYFQF